MKKLINLVAGLAAAALLCVASASPSYAQGTSFVSGGGSDGNSCTRTSPCATIFRALGFAGSGGIVSCLDEGPYYESFQEARSFTLDCRGVVYAASSGFPISTNAPVVTIRNVIFDGASGGTGAVKITGGKVVFENCTFQNFTASPGFAIDFTPTVAGANLTITDSIFANNGLAGSGGGILIQPSSGVTTGAVIERTQFAANTFGLAADGYGGGTSLVEVRYSTIADSIFDGIWAVTTGSIASVVFEHSASVRNGGNGINAQGTNAYVSLNDSAVGWNGTGLTTSSGGVILSYKNNVISGNLSPGVTPTGTNLQ
jgi:hypothetical protein